jgi:opacity protein-like surface antigen
MKNRCQTGAVLSLAFLLLPTLLSGQTYFLGVSGGTARPLDPPYAKAYLNPSIGPGFHLLVRVTGRIGASFDFCFHNLPLDRKRYLEDKGGNASSATGSLDLDIVSMSLVGFANTMENPVSIYALGGMGYYRLNPKDTWLVSRWTDEEGQAIQDTTLIDLGKMRNRFALNAGLGANFRISDRFSFFAEYRYHWILMRSQKDPVTGETVHGTMPLSAMLAGIRMAY